MTYSYTFALMPIPQAAWDSVADAMEAAGLGDHFIAQSENGAPTVALDMHGIALVPFGDSDDMINSARLSQLVASAQEHAFRDGFAAGKTGTHKVDEAFARYEESEDLWDIL